MLHSGVVVYTDGSARPDTGDGGSGFHGYFYQDLEEGGKPTKLDSWVATTHGYFLEKDIPEHAKPVLVQEYINCTRGFDHQVTNNQGEIRAVTTFFKLYEGELKDTCPRVAIVADSQYTLSCLESWISGWKRKDWMTADGKAVKNRQDLEEVDNLIQAYKASGGTVEYIKVKGHSGELGNTTADYLAGIGTNMSEAQDAQTLHTRLSKPFTAEKHTVHPLINLRRVYFNTDKELRTPGVYYQAGWRGNVDFVYGKVMPETTYSVVQLVKPDEIMETVINRQCGFDYDYNRMVYAAVDRIKSKDVYPWIAEYGGYCLSLDRRCANLNFQDRKPVTREIRPIDLPLRAVDALNHLEELLSTVEQADPQPTADTPWVDAQKLVVVSDITSAFYEKQQKTVRKEVVEKTVLRSELKPGVKNIEVTANFVKPGGELHQATVKIDFHDDLPDRNYLKRLEGMTPRVSLIAWMASPKVYRYAVVIQCDEGLGIWSNYYANELVIASEKAKS